MTVSKNSPVNNYKGNGSATHFDFDFLIEDESELLVQHTDKDGVQTTLTLDIDYSIYETGNNNGSYITFPLNRSSYSVLASDETITLSLQLDIEQDKEYANSSKLNFKTLEWSLDYIVRILQIFNRQIERSAKFPEGSGITNIEFPNPEADKVIQWNEDGTKLINYDIDGKISAFESTVNAAIEEMESDVSSANQTANTALSNSETAIESANAALSNSNTALLNSQTALNNSASALSTAQAASNTAQTANQTANEAKNTADTTKSRVDTFETEMTNEIQTFEDYIENSIDTVIEAAGKINELEEAIETANHSATEAKAQADIAQSNAIETIRLLSSTVGYVELSEVSLDVPDIDEDIDYVED